MSITILIEYSGKNGAARGFTEEMPAGGTVAAIRKEACKLRYEYFLPMDDAKTVLLLDSWEDQESIDRRHRSPMMITITALREKYDLHMWVERYRPEEGLPDGDRPFIRA